MSGSELALNTLACEILVKIFVNLPYQHVRKCEKICQKWKEILSDPYFWRCYHYCNYRLEQTDQVHGPLIEWQSGLCPMYRGAYDILSILPSEVFDKLPASFSNGIVCPVDIDWTSDVADHQEFVNMMVTLEEAETIIHTQGYVYGGSSNFAWKSDGICFMAVCVFPWKQDNLPNAPDVTELFSVNKHLHTSSILQSKPNGFTTEDLRLVFSGQQNFKNDDYQKILAKSLGMNGQSVQICFNVGDPSHQLCPSPVFLLGRIIPGWVGGLVTGLW